MSINSEKLRLELNETKGLIVDLVEFKVNNLNILLRKATDDKPIKVIKLIECFYFKDFGLINCNLNGYRIIDLGVKLFNLAESYGKDPESFNELHLWSDQKSESKYSNYEFTGITAAFSELKVSSSKDEFFS